MSRRQRQLDELGQLCRAGGVGRAIDLAFEHVAQFGDEAEIVGLVAEALQRTPVTERVRRRFAELLERAS